MKQLLKKKLQGKKGFTLAELLIVVAIVAILAAIAIPTFSASLTEAKTATDDANIRNAMAVLKIAELTDGVEVDGAMDKPTSNTTYYFLKTGDMAKDNSAVPANAYKLNVSHGNCPLGFGHTEKATIRITYNTTSGWALLAS